jgi:hypothetical protein
MLSAKESGVATISSRAKELRAYLADRKPEKNLFVRLELGGKVEVLEVYRVPIERLTFNIRNGRFASELRAKEKVLGRKLDSNVAEDGKVIRELLLTQNEDETKALRDDLIKHDQIEAGIITADGAVINANRRMAVISSLFDQARDQRWAYLKVAVLPENVGEPDLWRIEAGLQFAKDFRLEYGPINELLKLREGIACGLDAKDIAATLMGRYTDKQVDARLRVLTLIDNYLDAISRPGDYAWIGERRIMEKFNSLSDNVIEGLKRAQFDPREVLKITNAGFALISKTGRSHWDIRKLAPIAQNPTAKKVLFDALPKDPMTADEVILEDAFSNAIDLVEDQGEKDKPDRLLKRALSALTSIDAKSPKLKSAATQDLVREVIQASEALLIKRK